MRLINKKHLKNKPPEIVADSKADGSGRFTFSPPGPGKYYVAATSADSRVSSWEAGPSDQWLDDIFLEGMDYNYF